MKCKQCGRQFFPTGIKQLFCSNKGEGNCKDKFHNINNPRGMFAHLANRDVELDHPFSSDALGQG